MPRGRYPGGGGGLVRNTDPETSHAAADRVDTKKIFAEIEALLRLGDRRELVSMEISRFIERHPWSVSPRPRQMEQAGIIVRTGTRYALGSNNTMTPQTTWRLREEGEPLTGPPPRKRKPCQWLHTDDGAWATKCGNLFVLAPLVDGVMFCPGCGKPIKDTPPEPRRRRRTKAEMAAARLPPDELPDWLR